MDKIRWCLRKKNGIEIVEPNENLSKAYIRKAEDSLRASATLKDNKDWEVSSAYYAQYFSLYAILMKIGIKCEIHSCTIAFMEEFLSGHFTSEEIAFVYKSEKARNDLQYYSDRPISDEMYAKILSRTPSFVAKCKQVLNRIEEKEVKTIRESIRLLGKEDALKQ